MLHVDYSPTNKLHCQGCHRLISVGELRAGSPTTNTWKHIDCLTCSDIGLQLSRCFTALVYQQKPNLIESFVPLSHLSVSDQQRVRPILFALAVSGWQHYRQNQQTATSSSSASVDSDEQALLRKLAMNSSHSPCSKEASMRFSSPPRHPVQHSHKLNTTPTNRRPATHCAYASMQPTTVPSQRLHGIKRRPSFDSPSEATSKRRR